MGITGLTKFLKDKNIKYQNIKSFDKLTNQVIAIDAYNYMNIIYSGRTKYIIDDMEFPYSNFNENILKDVFTIICNRIKKLIVYNCEMIFIFEKTEDWINEAKQETKDERIKKLNINKDKYNKILNSGTCIEDFTNEEIKELKKRYINSKRPNSDFYEKMLLMMKDYKIAHMVTKCEGEKMCVMLRRNNHVNYIFSNDSDCLAMSCDRIIKKMDFKTNEILVLNSSKILKQLNLKSSQFLDFCILCKCDFNKKVFRTGTKTVFKNLFYRNNDINYKYLICKNIQDITDLNWKGINEKTIEELYNYTICRKIFNCDLDIRDYVIEACKITKCILSKREKYKKNRNEIDFDELNEKYNLNIENIYNF